MHPLHEFSKCRNKLSSHIVVGKGLAYSASSSMGARFMAVTKKNQSIHLRL
ncbi:BgTH12-01495 [Blumeria graminis f. sp. triticale]|uniref:BgTH12-01495 n=1 Tax=Blumeria graminis f. sp. triticale TaxID=1689686 RepID=A0A9W4CYU9_BLUGR|nr:BgTH12-01495 [Blumeria graminis f. sp. triticale]